MFPKFVAFKTFVFCTIDFFEVMESTSAAQCVDGVAYHWYDDFLEKPSIFTETHDSFSSLFYLPTEVNFIQSFMNYTKNIFRHARVICLFKLALD